jgi:DNA-binding transcriptional regulator LsrR (DeoR family)
MSEAILEKRHRMHAVITALWDDGLSTSQIADRLGMSARQILNYKHELRQLGIFEWRLNDLQLAEQGRQLLATGQYDPEWVQWSREIEQHYRKQRNPVRVEVVPTNEYSDDPWKCLAVLGRRAGEVLVEYIGDRNPHRILVGLGKHIHAVCSAIRKVSEPSRELEWLPSMPTYSEWPFFNANDFCHVLQTRLGGTRPVELVAPGFVKAGADDLIRVYKGDESHVRLFGGSLTPDPDLEPAGEVQTVTGLAWDADTAIAGCGVAAAGNPLIETRHRFRDRRRLRDAEYGAVGDLNGFYHVVRPDGQTAVLSGDPDRPDEKNVEAWDANRRALGASLELYAHIAKRHRRARHPHGGGVIVVANAADRAPVVYAMLQNRLVNTVILDYPCARKLRTLLTDPSKVVASVPARVAF